jgi:cardiolipin synthase
MSAQRMTLPGPESSRAVRAELRALADQAFARAAAAPLIAGNRLDLLRDAAENYPAWLAAIAAARRTIHFECYIIHDDAVGREFAEALMAKARAGVSVRLIYDWFGALGAASFRFWRQLRRAGVEVRCFNPPRLDSPFGWVSRDHRKMLAVDGRVAFVMGLCVGRAWVGEPARGVAPWRDTGVAIEGPAVADVERAFAAVWALTGPPRPAAALPAAAPPAAGPVALRVVASVPNTAGMYRLDQLVAALARRSIWLTDAYFLGTSPYVEALKAAAHDGVDVRLLVPRATDVPGMRALSRAGFRGLLQAGVRIYEWSGPMLHAKTAVADGRWARVGSTNLNLTSWVGNWELDVVAEDEPFAHRMEAMYLDDLGRAVEIVLREGRRVRPAAASAPPPPRRRAAAGSSGRAAAGVLRIGNTVGAALVNRRALGPAEARLMLAGGVLLLLLAAVAYVWPRVVDVPVVVVSFWVALTLLIRAWRLRGGGP